MACNFARIAGLDCCHPVNPFGNRKRICCDFNGTCCAHYPEDSRDCFWPDFTHPRWLKCRILYGCKPLSCGRGFVDADRHFDENERRRCGCARSAD